MNERSDDEILLSQLPALHLLQKLGFKLVTRSTAARERRDRLRSVLLEDTLAAAIRSINTITFRRNQYPFSEANIITAIERLKNVSSAGLPRTNELLTDLLLFGTSLEQTVDGDVRSHQLRYIDWDDTRSNLFHVAAEFELARSHGNGTRRPDLVLFVNGIPLASIECKAPGTDITEAISQTIRNQTEHEIPGLFSTIQLVLAVNKNSARYATVGTASKFWSIWREREFTDASISTAINQPLSLDQQEVTFQGAFESFRIPFEEVLQGRRAVTEQDRVLYSLCKPERLLELVRRYTVFDQGVKKVARYQQFFAVRELMRRVKTRSHDGKRLGGVIWHTQGSGKSLTMVFMAHAIALDQDIQNPKIVLVTDRVDLDNQLHDTFAACGLEPKQAKSGRHLLSLINSDKSHLITTLINKFDTAVRARTTDEVIDSSTEVFLLVDESHRSNYGPLHARMRKVFPNACYIGFTGTPLMKAEKSTFDKFGGVIDIYAIDQAVADRAVVPLLYEARHAEQHVNEAAIDRWFDRVCEGLTAEQKADLKRKYSRAGALNQTEQTIFCIAFDVSEHFRQNWQGTGLKAQLVAPSKRAALHYKAALDDIGLITSEVIISAPDDREGYETIDDEPADEVLRFWKRTMERFGDEREYNRRVVEAFKKRPEPELLIVVDKLLTGFDAPRNTVLYLGRRLKGHSLLQAIARVNRIEDGKEYGFVVDYQGLLGELDRALTTYSALEGYSELDLHDTVKPLSKEVERLPQRHSELWDVFKEVPNKIDEEALEQHLADESRRELFYARLRDFASTLSIALSSAAFVNDPSNDVRCGRYRSDLRKFEKLRISIKRRYQESISFREYEPRIRKLLDKHVSAHDVVQLSEPVNIFDEEAFLTAVEQQATTASKADLIASAATRTITERFYEDPAFYEGFSKLIQDTIDDFRRRRISEVEYLKRISELRSSLVHRKGGDVPQIVRDNGDARAFYGVTEVILRGAYHGREGDVCVLAAEAALTLASIVRAHIIVNWVNNDDVKNSIINDMDDYLFDTIRNRKGVNLTTEAIDRLVEQIMQIARYRMAA